MKKCRITAFIASLALLLSLCACASSAENYISGKSPDVQLPPEDVYEEYDDAMYGVKIAYPEGMERDGEIDQDGYIAFTEGEETITVFMPDAVSAQYETAENYARSFLGLMNGNVLREGEVEYERCRGYEVVSSADGRTTVYFVARGKDTFYHFSYACPDEMFDSTEKLRKYIFNSVRIDDGTAARLTELLSAYSSLLNFATSYDYIADANYAMHSIQNYSSTKMDYHLDEAIATYKNIQKSLERVLAHSFEEDCPSPELWDKVYKAADSLNEKTSQICALLSENKASEASKLAFSAYNYDLQLGSLEFLEAIATWLEEY